jgi:hypothetical protein
MSMPAEQSAPANSKSGKLLILAVFAVGLAAAAASWWFRYAATHRAAEFWGPTAVRLIRDAPRVTLRTDSTQDEPLDISDHKGITHLRNALLEDRSYDWTAVGLPDTDWANSLVFERSEGAEPRVVVLFSPDFQWAANGSAGDPADHAISTQPIADGLAKFFASESDAPANR